MAENILAGPVKNLLIDLTKYASTSGRLFFIEEADTWRDFHNEVQNEEYYDLSPEELCQMFTQVLLPQVNKLALPDTIKNQVKILDLHPQFKTTVTGYEHLSPSEREIGRFPAQSLVSQQRSDLLAKQTHPDIEALDKSFQLEPSQSVVHTKFFQNGGRHFQGSPENAAFLSAVLAANKQELAACVLHEPDKIHERLRLAKHNFENRGLLGPFCDDMERILKQVELVKKLRRALINVVSKSTFNV